MPATTYIDPRETSVAELHRVYAAKQLRILVGNGLSIGSGLPTWDLLNQRLLHQLIDSDAREGNVWATALDTQIQLIRDALYDAIGRDAAADFVKTGKPELFYPALARALYEGAPAESLAPTATHEQLAAMSGQAALATTNFDPLLELAIAGLHCEPDNWQRYRALPVSRGKPRPGVVEHLHGWIDPDGTPGEKIILTEADYFDLARNESEPANERLRTLFTSAGAALVLGMSMADINIRRLLYLLSRQPLRKNAAVYLVLKQREPLVDSYTQKYWEQRKLRLLFIDAYEEIPGMLRDIQWAPTRRGTMPGWLETSQNWREEQCPENLLFGDDWQALAFDVLRKLRRQIRSLFAVPTEERCHLSLFVPLHWGPGDGVRLSLIASSRRRRTGADALTFAKQRSLDIRKGSEQGLAAIAFTRGLERESLYGDDGLDYNFTPEMQSQWVNEQGYRDWRSVLAVPWIASPSRVPIAVMTVTSNLPEPFWNHFEDDTFREELLDWMRETSRWVLGGFA